MLDGDQRRIGLPDHLEFTLRGTPVIRYGEEIGMGEDRQPARARGHPHADAVVSAAQRRLFGCPARRLVLPVVTDGPFGYEKVNVRAQA